MRILLQSSTAQELLFFMANSTDHITGKTGLSPTVTLRKAGGGSSWNSPTGAVTEVGSGWYQVAGNATDTGTLGPLLLHATGTGADPADQEYEVVAFNPQDSVRLGQTALPNVSSGSTGGVLLAGTAACSLQTSSGLITLPSITSGWLTAAGIAAAALNGKGDWATAGSNMGITTAAAAVINAGLLAYADAIKTGQTFAQSLKVMGSAMAGTTARPDSTSVTFSEMGGGSTIIACTLGGSGNKDRTNIVLTP